jgi:uncharacterized protein
VSRYTVSVIRILLFALLFLPAAGQEYAMRWYVLGILEKGPTWSPEVTEQSKKLQEGHIVAGPLADAGDFRGIFLFDTEKVEEARQWSDSDPAVQAGRLKVRLMRWYAAKGIKPDPPVSK